MFFKKNIPYFKNIFPLSFCTFVSGETDAATKQNFWATEEREREREGRKERTGLIEIGSNIFISLIE